MRHAALTLLAVAHLAGTAVAAARASNKTANTATITIIDGSFPFAADQLLLGAYMAATELNANTSILQDVSLSINRVVMPQAERQPAVVYDMAAGLCNAAQTSAFLSFVTSGTALAIAERFDCALTLFAQLPHFSPTSASVWLSDKRRAPLFYRSVTPFSQVMLSLAAPIKFFGWTKVGIVYGETGVWRDVALVAHGLFRDQGIDVLASVKMPDYRQTISTLYYPQLRSSFEFLRSTKLRIFMLLTYSNSVMDALTAANRTGLIGRDYVWTSINSFYFDPAFQNRWGILAALMTPGSSLDARYDDPYFMNWIPRFAIFANQTLTNQPGLFRDVNFQQTDTTAPDYQANFFYDDPGTNTLPAYLVDLGYDAVNSLAFTFETLITDKSATGTELCNGSLAQFYSIDRLTRPFKEQQTLFDLKQFTPQGDPVASAYAILQCTGQSFVDYVISGNVTLDPMTGAGTFGMNRITFIWAGNRSLDDVPRDFPPTPEDFVDIKSPSTIMVILISAAVALASLACAAIIAMRQIAPPTVPIVGLGLAVTQTNVLTMIGKDKPVACALRPWPIVLGLSIVLGAMALKAVFTLINTRWGAMIKSINKTHINLAVAAVVLLFGTLLAVQSATCPLRSEAVFLDWLGGFAYTCVRQGPLSALAILQIAGIAFLIVAVAWLSFATRDLPEKLNDSKQTGASVATIAMFGAVVILQSTTQASVVSQFLFETACVVVASSFVCWVYLGIPIWRHMQQAADRTRRIHVHRSVRRSAVRTAQLSTESDSVSLDTSFKPFRGEIAEEQQRHAHYMTMRAMIARSGVLQQWRSSVVTLLPAPLFMIRIASEDLTEASTWLPPIEFLPLSAISSVECGDENDAMGCRVCELTILRRRMRMWFGDSVKAQTWTDAIARLALQRLGRDVSEGAGQLLNRVQTALRRKCPDKISQRIARAQRSQFFILQECGPMAFVLRESDDAVTLGHKAAPHDPQAAAAAEAERALDGITDSTADNSGGAARTAAPPPSTTHSSVKKVKVALGESQTCSCSKHLSDGDLCVHILWVMLKIFHVDPASEMIYQKSLVEREINEMLRLRRMFQPKVDRPASDRGTSDAGDAEQGQTAAWSAAASASGSGARAAMSPRPIEAHDVCPICQEELLDPPSPLAHCRFSCGNSIHVKCMKVLMEHENKSLGMDSMKCPAADIWLAPVQLCRENFGSMDDLKKTFLANEGACAAAARREARSHIHVGHRCRECQTSPITGKLHKCMACTVRDTKQSGGLVAEMITQSWRRTLCWKPRQSERVVQTMLPPNLVASLETRELTDADYEMLLTLDKPQAQGSIPLHIINGFPMIKIKGPVDKERVRLGETDGACGVCLVKIGYGEIVRQIPCGHGFHQPCIDRWLLHHRTVCPKCGLAAYCNVNGDEVQMGVAGEAPDINASVSSMTGRKSFGPPPQLPATQQPPPALSPHQRNLQPKNDYTSSFGRAAAASSDHTDAELDLSSSMTFLMPWQ
ncbi:E3 ubiquitin-protein ligase Zswim2 [Polyrhizophydium stewartii]|uniref:E3 ubiquitin-protein ligase Zswim2 n=1 Tax=Polyrhizophydium stewartii TaxID=2732419 RepID=A0ABR4NAY5_9FUNG